MPSQEFLLFPKTGPGETFSRGAVNKARARDKAAPKLVSFPEELDEIDVFRILGLDPPPGDAGGLRIHDLPDLGVYCGAMPDALYSTLKSRLERGAGLVDDRWEILIDFPIHATTNQAALGRTAARAPGPPSTASPDPPQVRIVVLDSGIFRGHSAFQNAEIRAFDVPANAQAPISVKNYDGPRCHGTGVCGVVLASAPRVFLDVFSVLDDSDQSGSLCRLARSLNKTLSNDEGPPAVASRLPTVVNMSFGVGGVHAGGQMSAKQREDLLKFQKFIQALKLADILPIAAVGNGGKGLVDFPAAFPEVMGVGAISASFSGYAGFEWDGSEVRKPDLAGWGQNVTVPGCDGVSDYDDVNGTTYASAYVAGIAAQYWAREPSLHAEAVADSLCENARQIGHPTRVGCGLAQFL